MSAVRAKRSLADFLGPLAVFGVFIGFWYLAAYKFVAHNFAANGSIILVPPPHRVLESMGDQWPKIMEATWLTARTALLGLGITIVLGVWTAIVMSQARWLEKAFYPYLVALQATPILALTPLIANILGANFRSRVVVVILISIFPIVANTLFGLNSVESNQHDLMTLAGVSRWTRLVKLQFPAAMPPIFTGLEIAAGLSVIGAIVGDFFFQRGDVGLGYRIQKYYKELKPGQMFVSSFMAIMLGIVVFLTFKTLSRRVIGHWHATTFKP